MKSLVGTACAVLLGVALNAPASAHSADCSVDALVGRWIFATGIGRQMLGGPFPPDKDITAIGTMNVRPGGRIDGEFDATVEDTMFLPDVVYSGTIVLAPDCTGLTQNEKSRAFFK